MEKIKWVAFMTMYSVCYILTFAWLENRDVEIYIIHTKIDEMIPFCKYFIVPYLFWFLYLGITAVYFLFYCDDPAEMKKMILTYCTGMTLFLLVSALFPNGHILRPELVGEDLFTRCVRFVYRMDTATNILPSMHVFAAVASSVGFLRQEKLRKNRWLALCIRLCCILIVLSTVFLKQHSIVDVITALLLNALCYGLFYNKENETVWRSLKISFSR